MYDESRSAKPSTPPFAFSAEQLRLGALADDELHAAA
jgi:hypothetical protein